MCPGLVASGLASVSRTSHLFCRLNCLKTACLACGCTPSCKPRPVCSRKARRSTSRRVMRHELWHATKLQRLHTL